MAAPSVISRAGDGDGGSNVSPSAKWVIVPRRQITRRP